MGNIKNKIIGIVLIFTITMATGCGITITKNQYYVAPDKFKKLATKKNNNTNNQTYALKNMKNGQNR